MEANKQLLVYIKPPKTISQQIFCLNQEISSKFHNDYLSHLKSVWESHLMVYLSPMLLINTDKILKIVGESALAIKPFMIKLGDFTTKEDKYLFVSVEEQSQAHFKTIHDDLVLGLKDCRDQTISKKYLDRWDNFSDEEKERIQNTGLPYLYEPHMTVARLLSEELSLALEIIKDKSLRGQHFIAEKLCVAQESDEPEIDWTILAEYNLGSK